MTPRNEHLMPERSIGIVIKIEEAASAALLMLILGMVSLQAAGRYLFVTPPVWTDEIARLALVWLTFVASTFVMARGQHITVRLFDTRLGQRGATFLEVLSSFLVAVTALAFLPSTYRLAERMHGVESPAAGFPRSLVYIAALVGLALIAVHGLLRAAFPARHRAMTAERDSVEEQRH